MPTTTEAEEHLRVIRSLMEKATIYRAISAPSALVGGILTIITASFCMAFPAGRMNNATSQLNFALVWLSVLILSTAANLYFLRKDASRRGETFFSGGMRLAVASLLPSFIAAGFFTVIFGFLLRQAVLIVCFWLIFYGLGLLATAHFAPRSMKYLGWTFLFAGFAVLAGAFGWLPDEDDFRSWRTANITMAVTFGGFHVIYAACTWPRRERSIEAAATPSTDV